MKGHIRKRGSKWCFVLDIGRDPKTGQRRQKWFSGFKTKREAERAMAAKIHELNQGGLIEPAKITLEEYLKRWLEDYAKTNCAPRTYEGYEYIITRHLIPSLGKMTLDKLKPLHIQRYYSEKLSSGRTDGKGGLSARSVYHHHRVLHEALEQAVKWQVIAVNPVRAVSPPKPKRKQLTVLTRDEVLQLLKAAEGSKLYEPIFFAVNTGMRRGELFALRWSDVDFENQVISVRQTLYRTKSDGFAFRDAAKTDGSRRSVAVSGSIVNMLKRIKKEQAANKLALGPAYQDHDLIFCKDDGSPYNLDYVSRDFGRLVRKHNLPPIRFHDLRHTHATLLLQQGEHPKIVSERLGHSTITITMDLYSHVLPNMQKEAAQKLDDHLFGGK
ncbi:site-specific integrase [Thermoactinomyces intermedius]|jgi:integrase|uniref:Site-specific integrase n=1 Tax=Thermoactinomyces intermedius TaxID=2024 RepID=A0A8I1AEF9_THEIN|nr:site-specific integrase [Thermoactinomyces intermedius]MBA4550022.1 site-specific integrase [Thermoactinomyces intermedius]MBA4835768.1 site-specific integrase [Thermoactinomyces intermedius]MBH8596351.1 site-specific integrase [Thermoactinomyces intermedius]